MKERDYEIIVLKRLIEKEELLLFDKEAELRKLPEGTLIIRKKNNKIYYTSKDSCGEHGITKNPSLVFALSRRQYLYTSIANHKVTINLLKKTYTRISNNKEKTLHQLPLSLYSHSQYSNKELHWINTIKSQNPYTPEHLVYKCNNGISVRSKSERTIANKLYDYGIVFKYEAPIEIDGKVLYPDFTILRNDGKIVLWEHNGLMTNEEYLIRSLQKIRKYKKAGFVQHTNLICTEESDILDEGLLDEIILRYILL